MPKIYPFHGWHYNPEKITRPEDVITPPYDVISPADQDAYHDASPYNYVRLILNREPGKKRYPAAAATLKDWINQEIMIRDEAPAVYLLAQTFQRAGQTITRQGVIAAMEVVPFGEGVLPHEYTFPKTVKDRYDLMEATQANMGQIFLSYRDQKMVVENLAQSVISSNPLIDVNLDQVQYQIWPLTDPEQVASICDTVGKSTIIVADGHHRYTTAVLYRRNNPEQAGADRVMVTLVNSFNPGMDILPTHRLIRGIDLTPDSFREVLPGQFTAVTVESLAELDRLVMASPDNEVRLGFHFKNSGKNLLVKAETGELPATVLHDRIITPILNLDVSKPEDKDRVTYLRGADNLATLLDDIEPFDLACLVKPPTLNQVFDIAEAGGLMPQKSTYFYPKVYSGLLLRKISKNI